MLTKEEKISSLNKELYRTIKYTNKYSSSSSHDQKALELAQVIYSHSPSTFAYQCRVIALIRLGQFNKAIDLLDQHSTSDDGLLYEKAYCYYRTLQLEKALELLDQLRKHAQYWQQNKLAICHLQAQIYYTQERYPETIELYNQLINWSGIQDEELQANILAVNACLSMNHQEFNIHKLGESLSYENMYNMACIQLGKGQIPEAEKLLIKARKLCSQSNVSADEMEQDLVVIATQLAYTLQLMGNNHAAMETYQSVLLSGLSDQLAVAIASNNTLSIDSSMDLFQTAKLLRPIHHLSPLHAQMKAFQKRKSLLNEAILQYRMRKTSSCFKIIHHQLGLDDDTVCLLLVAASNTSKQQIMLMDFIKERPISIPLHLALIQLQLQSNQTDQALITLLGLLQARTVIPIALSALLIWLLQQTGQSERAYEILDSISDRLMAQRTHLPLLKQIASFHLKSQRYQVAQKQYEFLVRFDPTDAQSIAGLITAYMITEPQKADKYAATLPKVNINHLDAKVLEYSIPGVQSKIIDHATKMKKKKMKKKRKPLLPKGAENQTLDPERWLPLSQRTSSKK